MLVGGRTSACCLILVLGMLLTGWMLAEATDYDPLAVPGDRSPRILDLNVEHEEMDRVIPIRVYMPFSKAPAAVVLFSHGLGGSRKGSSYLGRHWALRGYVCIFLQHPGSDESVWKGKPRFKRFQALKRAVHVENFMLRVKDVYATLDRIEIWNRTPGHKLAGRMNLRQVGMSGHSFGAATTQAVSGQRYRRGRVSFTDPRIKAALILSPARPIRDGDLDLAFGQVKIPWMLMTGTKDKSLVADLGSESRLAVFPRLPEGLGYELVLYKAEHSAFSERALPFDREKRNPNHHRVILALSTAFWDARLRGDSAARAWLDHDGPNSVLETNDRWRKK